MYDNRKRDLSDDEEENIKVSFNYDNVKGIVAWGIFNELGI